MDRLHNISTLNGSSLEQRKKQYEETSKVFLPITKAYRRIYWENATFFNIARNELQGYLAEIKRSIESEEEIEALKNRIKELESKEILQEMQNKINTLESKVSNLKVENERLVDFYMK